jgi:uncharacterized protein
MNLYDIVVPQSRKMLKNLDRWLVAGLAHADRKQFDPSVLVHARLAPDQYSFARQVGAACDAPKFLAARLTGKEAPRHEDNDQTFEALRARITSVIEYLDGFKPQDFEGGAERAITPGPLKGRKILGVDYALEMQLPNFYFHLVHAYAILRHNGVELGKLEFLGKMKVFD